MQEGGRGRAGHVSKRFIIEIVVVTGGGTARGLPPPGEDGGSIAFFFGVGTQTYVDYVRGAKVADEKGLESCDTSTHSD